MKRQTNEDSYILILNKLLADVHRMHGCGVTQSEINASENQLKRRFLAEGMSFLTKALPTLGKALDKALSSFEQRLEFADFEKSPASELPSLFGWLWRSVFDTNGNVLPASDAKSVGYLRQLLYVFYKLELPYDDSTKEGVIARFEETEREISLISDQLDLVSSMIDKYHGDGYKYFRSLDGGLGRYHRNVIVRARWLLWKLFRRVDLRDIRPKHGPGAVSTKETGHQKYMFKRVNPRIDAVYPYDEYFCSSMGHVCDRYKEFDSLPVKESDAKVILVPKDSRGPRLISEEPLENQWIQQGIKEVIVNLIEHHPLTREHVHFTDQNHNRRGAFLGSIDGRYATLDLKDASDRVTIGLVRLLFPSDIVRCLEACRSLATILPNGKRLALKKFAPMGSALCFPIMALSIWALITAAVSDPDARESLRVYGDDVIVKTASADAAITVLESFGLKVNSEKSCRHGFFRESCGLDAYKRHVVTPVRIKTVWSRHRAANTYTSWIAYSNNLYLNGYRETSEYIAEMVQDLYGPVPSSALGITAAPSLLCIPENDRLFRRRVNPHGLQRLEWLVPVSKSMSSLRGMDGWLMLLRYFAEATEADPSIGPESHRSPLHGQASSFLKEPIPAFSVRRYTRRDTNKIVLRWRGVS